MNDDALEVEMHGPVRCGQGAVRLTVEAFDMSNDVLPPDQAEEAAVKDTLLQRFPRISAELKQERIKSMEALTKGLRAAKQEVKHVVRLSALVLKRVPDAFGRALFGDPPIKVPPMTLRRKPGVGMMRARSSGYSQQKTASWSTEHFEQSEATRWCFCLPWQPALMLRWLCGRVASRSTKLR